MGFILALTYIGCTSFLAFGPTFNSAYEKTASKYKANSMLCFGQSARLLYLEYPELEIARLKHAPERSLDLLKKYYKNETVEEFIAAARIFQAGLEDANTCR